MVRFLNHFNDGLRARAVLVLSFGPETVTNVVAYGRQPIRLSNTTISIQGGPISGVSHYTSYQTVVQIFSRESRYVRNGVVGLMLLGEGTERGPTLESCPLEYNAHICAEGEICRGLQVAPIAFLVT